MELKDYRALLDELDGELEQLGCSMKAQMQIDIALYEILANISFYAYAPDTGKAVIRVKVSGDPAVLTIAFMDHGMPFDPLAQEDPDVSLPADERPIGGLGVFLVKQAMDDVRYEYRDGQNILTLKKNL